MNEEVKIITEREGTIIRERKHERENATRTKTEQLKRGKKDHAGKTNKNMETTRYGTSVQRYKPFSSSATLRRW